MALSLRNLAFSWSEAPLGHSTACHLLLLRRTNEIEAPRTPLHSHAFWQMEYVTDGELLVKGANQSFRLSQGDAVLLPPHVPHQFIYDNPNARFMSFAFGLEGQMRATSLHHLMKCSLLSHVIQAIQSLMPDSNFPDDRVRLIIASLLSSIVSYVYAPKARDDFRHLGPLVQRTLEFVRARNGGQVTAHDVADHLGYTANYISSQFHKLTGESLKGFLDRQRAEKAKDLLRYTNLSMTQIGRQLEFNDLFSFSRYFHRVVGISPRQFRRQEQK